MFERFTAEARAVVVQAHAEATALGAAQVGAEHLVLAAIALPGYTQTLFTEAGAGHDVVQEQLRPLGTLDAEALATLGIDLDAVLELAEQLAPGSRERAAEAAAARGRADAAGLAPSAKRALQGALQAAVALRSRRMTVAHLVLGALAEDSSGIAGSLEAMGVDVEALQADLADVARRAA